MKFTYKLKSKVTETQHVTDDDGKLRYSCDTTLTTYDAYLDGVHQGCVYKEHWHSAWSPKDSWSSFIPDTKFSGGGYTRDRAMNVAITRRDRVAA